MITDTLRERFDEIEQLARGAGLDPYDVHFLEVPASLIYEVASYGLPTRYSHWSFGASYQHVRTQGEMGFSKIYELILNNDPSYAFLDKNNTDTINLLIAAHCFGHSFTFKNNILFKKYGERDMINVAKHHADVIDQFRTDYGDEEVDEWLDVALSLERHIDVYRGLKRTRYPQRHIKYEERNPDHWEDIVYRNPKPTIKKVIDGIYLPPHPEKDVLWFLSEYANLEPWQQKIFQIVRRESYYFFPQYLTKILNEGCASYYHAELMHQYFLGNDNDYGVKIKHPLTSEEHLDFAAAHEKVVQPGFKMHLKIDVPILDPNGKPTGKTEKQWNLKLGERPELFSSATRLNPYYVGFKMLRHIKEKWDKYCAEGFYEDEWGTKIPVTMNGDAKIKEVVTEEDDVSFLRNYLTEELCEELHLFAYGNIKGYNDDYAIQEDIQKRLHRHKEESLGQLPIDEQYIKNKTIVVKTKEIKDILSTFAKSKANYGSPNIVVRRVDESGLLRLEHLTDDSVNLDINYAKHVVQYIFKAWGRPVELIRKSKDKTWSMTFDGMNFDIDHEELEYPDVIEQKQTPSSW